MNSCASDPPARGPSRASRPGPLLLALALLVPAARATDDVRDLAVGHWVRVKGALDASGVFVGEEVELQEPSDEEGLLGTASAPDLERGRFVVLGLPVHVAEDTEWTGVTLEAIDGARVLVQGHYRGPLKFSGNEIEVREKGRDRIEGRIDAIRPGPEGRLELQIMSFRVLLSAVAKLEAEHPVQDYQLAEARPETQVFQVRDDDEVIPGAVQLTDTLSFGGQLEWKTERQDNYDLDDDDRNDENRNRASIRGEFFWEPRDDFFFLLGLREEYRVNREEEDPTERDLDGSLTEAYGFWRDPFGLGLDVQAGRQDFDEPREWLYDRDLDALRGHWQWAGGRLELSGSTLLADGSRADREAYNFIAYLSNDDWDRHLGAYVIDRRNGGSSEDKPIFIGARALGEWLPDNDVWLELSAVRGYNDAVDFRGEGYDLGTTWTPDFLSPVYLTAGYAYGTGDEEPGDDVDDAFQQTGLQDNNAKFGGVTSFRYYGELVDPELSNLGILTLGIGTRLTDKTSLDLVWHAYEQNEAADSLLDTDLDMDPDGVHKELGTELDLILGLRQWRHWEVEVVLAGFEPGKAFPDADDAWLGAFQLRYRF